MQRVEQRLQSNQVLANAANSAMAGDALRECAKSSKRTIDSILYITAEVTQGGNFNVFEQLTSQKSVVGQTNFDGEVLAAGKNAVVDGISMTFATTTTNANPLSLDFSETPDAAIRNAEFDFKVDGKLIISLPVFDIHAGSRVDYSTLDDMYRNLGHLPIIEAQKKCEGNFRFPQSVSPDTGSDKKKRHYVRIALRVNKTISR